MSAWLSVHFECQSDKQTTIREVDLSPVTSVLGIKEYFEEKFNIPVCMQTLYHSSVVLRDDTSVASLRLRDGDTLHVSYHATAECEQLHHVIHWLETLASSFKEGDLPNASVLRNDQMLEQLAFDFFSPWNAPEKYANKQFFITNGGLKLLMQVYSNLLKYQWNDLPEDCKNLEPDILTSLGYLAIDIPFRHAILKESGLKMCLMSLLRVPVHADEPLALAQRETIGGALWVLTW